MTTENQKTPETAVKDSLPAPICSADRRDILLRAAYDLLKRSTRDHYVREATAITVRYDEANCDGYCLMEDIASELDIDDEDPIPLGPEDE